jgi:hypothetical protein
MPGTRLLLRLRYPVETDISWSTQCSLNEVALRRSHARRFQVCAQVIAFLCMMACALGNARVAIAGLLASSVAFGLCSFNLYTIGQMLAGPRAAGKWIAIQNAIGNLPGIVAPTVTGRSSIGPAGIRRRSWWRAWWRSSVRAAGCSWCAGRRRSGGSVSSPCRPPRRLDIGDLGDLRHRGSRHLRSMQCRGTLVTAFWPQAERPDRHRVRLRCPL